MAANAAGADYDGLHVGRSIASMIYAPLERRSHDCTISPGLKNGHTTVLMMVVATMIILLLKEQYQRLS